MKRIHLASIVALLSLLTFAAYSQITGSANIEEAKAAVEKKCINGCIVLSREDMATLEGQINEALQEAYKIGLHTCRNSI
jgi:hypothetical protein